MKNRFIILIIVGAIMLLPQVMSASSGILVTTWGYRQPTNRNASQQVGTIWLLGGRTAACTTIYACLNYSACGVNYRKECLVVTDITCGVAFTGDETDYNADCDWCDENPDLEVCSRERNNMYLLIFIPLVMGLFALIGAATLDQQHGAMKIALFMLSFISVIGAAYVGSNIVSTTDSQVQGALGVTTNWITWIFIIVVFYFLIYLIYNIFTTIGRQKEENLRY